MILVNLKIKFLSIRVLVIFALIFILMLPSLSKAEKRTSLILYDDVTEDYSIALFNLLGHFYYEYEVTLSHIMKVDIQEVKKVDALFILATHFSLLPPSTVLNEISERALNKDKITCLIGTPPWFRRVPNLKSFPYVEYKGYNYREGNYNIFPLDIHFDFVLSSLHDGDENQKTPFIGKFGNVWLIQGFPFFGLYSWIFADFLHDLLNVEHKIEKKVFLRLEDVNPSYTNLDIDKLRECVEYLYSERIPFAVAVYPVFMNLKKGKAITLLENPKLLDLLRRIEGMGGSIIMHGVTHQHYQIETSGEGSEFWNIFEDRPIPNEKEYFNEKMKEGLGIFKEAKLTPLFFEAPHYNLPLNLQFELSKYFDTMIGVVLLNNRTYKTSQSFPFIIYKSHANLAILPEQLGYISTIDVEGSINLIKERAKILKRIVRDPVACFFYHPYVGGVKFLKEMVNFFIDQGFAFIDISKYGSPPKLSFNEKSSMKILVEGKKESLRIGNTFLFISIISAVLLFFVYMRIYRRRKQRLFQVDRFS